MAAKAMLSERLLVLLEREIEDFERMADRARAAEAAGIEALGGTDAGDAGAADEGNGAVVPAVMDADAKGLRGGDDVAGSAGTTKRGAGRKPLGRVAASAAASATARKTTALPLGSAKERIDALGQLTRTLEKLLDLKRLERLASEGGQADEAETRRLRAELLTRLKSLDMRRREGATLFVGVDADAVFGGDG